MAYSIEISMDSQIGESIKERVGEIVGDTCSLTFYPKKISLSGSYDISGSKAMKVAERIQLLLRNRGLEVTATLDGYPLGD